MRYENRPGWGARWLSAIAVVVFLIAANSLAFAQDPNRSYRVGEWVDVRWAGDEQWYKAEILELKDGFYKIRYEVDGNIAFYQPERMRPLNGADQTATRNTPDAQTQSTPKSTGNAASQAQPPADGTLAADRPILACPVEHQGARNGQRPDEELLARIIAVTRARNPPREGSTAR